MTGRAEALGTLTARHAATAASAAAARLMDIGLSPPAGWVARARASQKPTPNCNARDCRKALGRHDPHGHPEGVGDREAAGDVARLDVRLAHARADLGDLV